jgi:hypothetical protein
MINTQNLAMTKIIGFRRRYTSLQWEKLEAIRTEHGYRSVTDMIRKRALKLANDTVVCEPCKNTGIERFTKHLEIIMPEETINKLQVLAKERGLKPGEFIARMITDPLI